MCLKRNGSGNAWFLWVSLRQSLQRSPNRWQCRPNVEVFLCAAPVLDACLPGLTFVPTGATGTAGTFSQTIEAVRTSRGRVHWLLTLQVLLYGARGLAVGSAQLWLRPYPLGGEAFPVPTGYRRGSLRWRPERSHTQAPIRSLSGSSQGLACRRHGKPCSPAQISSYAVTLLVGIRVARSISARSITGAISLSLHSALHGIHGTPELSPAQCHPPS